MYFKIVSLINQKQSKQNKTKKQFYWSGTQIVQKCNVVIIHPTAT